MKTELGLEIEEPGSRSRAFNGEKTPKTNGQTNRTPKARPRQHDTWIEHGRASVRREKNGGGLIVTRHITLLTFLPAKNLNRWAKEKINDYRKVHLP